MRLTDRSAAVIFGLLDLAVAGLIVAGVFGGLPARWLPVDFGASVLVALHVVSGVALLAGSRWAPLVARASSAVSLVTGLVLVSALAVTASWLSGVYGTVGRGGAVLYLLVAALIAPYLIVLPAVQLLWAMGRRDGR